MALFKTANPALGQNTFSDFQNSQTGGSMVDAAQRMTLSGTINKTGILLLCAVATAAWTWNSFMQTHDLSFAGPAIMIGVIGGLIFGVITSFKRQWSPVTAPIYALLEGLFLGAFSAMMELRFPGIAIQSVALTFGTCFCMLLAYRSGMIRATQRFTVGVIAATGGIALLYFASMILGFFHVQIPGIFGSGPIGILFSLGVVVIAALNLILDFSFVEEGAAHGAPKYMEWYSAFALMVTLVWLYLEVLRLLSKFRSRN